LTPIANPANAAAIAIPRREARFGDKRSIPAGEPFSMAKAKKKAPKEQPPRKLSGAMDRGGTTTLESAQGRTAAAPPKE